MNVNNSFFGIGEYMIGYGQSIAVVVTDRIDGKNVLEGYVFIESIDGKPYMNKHQLFEDNKTGIRQNQTTLVSFGIRYLKSIMSQVIIANAKNEKLIPNKIEFKRGDSMDVLHFTNFISKEFLLYIKENTQFDNLKGMCDTYLNIEVSFS